jgi:hypothetical protein
VSNLGIRIPLSNIKSLPRSVWLFALFGDSEVVLHHVFYVDLDDVPGKRSFMLITAYHIFYFYRGFCPLFLVNFDSLGSQEHPCIINVSVAFFMTESMRAR